MSIKNIALFLFLALPMGAHAQELSIAEANQAVINSCGANGGKMTEFKAGKCDFQRCIYSDNKSDGTFYRAGDNQRTNCSDSELKKELQKVKDDLGIDLDNNGGSGRGGRDGRGGDDDGDGRGGRDGRDSDGGNASAGHGEMAVVCDFVEGGLKLEPGSKCFKKCTKKVNGVRVADSTSSSCRKCLVKYHRNADGSPIVFKTDVRGTVTLGDVRVKTSEIVCRDLNTGKTVTVVGTKCNPGQVIMTGGNSGGTIVTSGGSSGGGVIVVNGGGTTTSSSSANLPAFCLSDKKKDKKECAKYLARQDRYRCASSSDTAGCIRDIDVIRSRYSEEDCVDCEIRRRNGGGGGSSFAEILGAALPPLAILGGAYFNSRAQIKSNQAWAGAAEVGFEQCQLHNNNYLQYISANELPGLTPEQQRMMGCNGFGLGQFAGMGGAFNGYMGAGYSPGFIGGMMGPYGGYNPYGGIGGAVGGAIGGYVGGIQGGTGGFPQGGFQGGFGFPGAGGIGGFAQGGIGGFPQGGSQGGFGYPGAGGIGGFPQGGFQGGIGGFPQGGFQGGIGGFAQGGIGGFPQGGFQGGIGFPGAGGIGGFAQGGIGGFPQGGFQGGIGFPGAGGIGGFPQGGIGGFPQGGFQGGIGFPGAGGIGGFSQGGFQGGFPPGGGFGGGGFGGGLGGWGSGVGGYGQNPYGYGAGYGFGSAYGAQASMQASSTDAMLQQRGVSYQMGMLGSGSMGAGGMTQAFGGHAGFSPMNMGNGLGGFGYMGM